MFDLSDLLDFSDRGQSVALQSAPRGALHNFNFRRKSTKKIRAHQMMSPNYYEFSVFSSGKTPSIRAYHVSGTWYMTHVITRRGRLCSSACTQRSSAVHSAGGLPIPITVSGLCGVSTGNVRRYVLIRIEISQILSHPIFL